jgi:hypothetical protein
MIVDIDFGNKNNFVSLDVFKERVTSGIDFEKHEIDEIEIRRNFSHFDKLCDYIVKIPQLILEYLPFRDPLFNIYRCLDSYTPYLLGH